MLLIAIRFLQFVLAITVCVLYGIDLQAAMKQHKYVDSKWVCTYCRSLVLSDGFQRDG